MASLEKDLAAEKLREQARDLYKLKITLPLGNKNLKLVHTNQFLWTEFPENVFKLENWKYIAEALDGDETSHTGYVKNRWFIESCTITNDGNNAKMELELNPFGTNQRSYIDDYESFTKAYDDAQKQKNENNNNENTTPSVAGDTNSLGDGSMTDADITKLAKKVSYGGMGSGHDPEKGFKNLTVDHRGDCYDITAGLYYAYNFKVGIPARDIVSSSKHSKSGTHHCCQIQRNGSWVFPDFYKDCTTDLKVLSNMRNGDFDVAREPPSSDGTIPKYCAKCKKRRWP